MARSDVATPSLPPFLAPSFPLCPLQPLHITLKGVTNDPIDPCVDTFRTVTLPLLRLAGIDEGIQLTIAKRGAPPLGGGEVSRPMQGPLNRWRVRCFLVVL